MKHFKLLIFTTLITISTSFSSLAGSWEEDAKGWWYKNDDGSYPRGTWFTFATTGKQYYFNDEGYLLINTTTPDGYKVGSDGAYLESDPSNIARSQTKKPDSSSSSDSSGYVNSGPGVVGNNSSSGQNNNNNNNNNNGSSNNTNNNTSSGSSGFVNSGPGVSGSNGSKIISSNAPDPDTSTVLKSPSSK